MVDKPRQLLSAYLRALGVTTVAQLNRSEIRQLAFQEDEWLGGVLSFGEGDDAPAVTVTMRDVRCSMVNLDPDSASPAPEVLKAVVRANQNNAGIYAAVTRTGRLAAGQTIFLRATTGKRERG